MNASVGAWPYILLDDTIVRRIGVLDEFIAEKGMFSGIIS